MHIPAERLRLLEQTETRRRYLSLFLGERAVSEPEKEQKPIVSTVQATILYSIATGRLNLPNTDYRTLQTPANNPTDLQTDSEDLQSSIQILKVYLDSIYIQIPLFLKLIPTILPRPTVLPKFTGYCLYSYTILDVDIINIVIKNCLLRVTI